MRRFLTVVVLAALAAAVSAPALADNQEVADEIAQTLRSSGQLCNYRIEVKFQKGTAWLTGHVQDESQMNAAMRLALATNEVNRVVNDLSVGSSALAAVAEPANEPTPASQAQRVASTFSEAPARQVTAVQPVAAAQQAPVQRTAQAAQGRPIPVAYTQPMGQMQAVAMQGGPIPAYATGGPSGTAPASYDQPNLPNYAWPSYASYPNYAALTYPRQYSPTAWPYIGPFYPYPQVPLGWRKVTLEWDDGWWMLDFDDSARH